MILHESLKAAEGLITLKPNYGLIASELPAPAGQGPNDGRPILAPFRPPPPVPRGVARPNQRGPTSDWSRTIPKARPWSGRVGTPCGRRLLPPGRAWCFTRDGGNPLPGVRGSVDRRRKPTEMGCRFSERRWFAAMCVFLLFRVCSVA